MNKPQYAVSNRLTEVEDEWLRQQKALAYEIFHQNRTLKADLQNE